MRDESQISRDVADRQIQMFGMFVGQGLTTTRAALARASKIPESTLRSYAEGAAMPLHAALTLRRFLPSEAINMLTEPGNVRFCSIDAEETNWDAIACDAAGLTFEICEARKDGVIDHQEKARLRSRGRQVIARLSDAIAED